jgi:outer membrane protein TolC
MPLADARALMREAAWATLHPDPALRQARARVLDTREAVRVALMAAKIAEAELRLVEARHVERRTLGPH